MSYNRMDHAGWAASNNEVRNQAYARRRGYRPAPEELTPFQAKVVDICGMVGGGIYNAPINWEKVDWGTGARAGWGRMFVPWRDGRMATFDSWSLTMFVMLCHEARIRGEITARAHGLFTLSFHERSHDGGIGARHPNLAEATAMFREYLPADHRVIYREPEVVLDEAAA